MTLAFCCDCCAWINPDECPHPFSRTHWTVYDEAGVVVWSRDYPPPNPDAPTVEPDEPLIVEVPPC